jgi:hypothetical protein
LVYAPTRLDYMLHVLHTEAMSRTMSMRRTLVFLGFFLLLSLAFFDLNNRLNLGPRDQDGFTALNHGALGTSVKILICAATLLLLYYLVSQWTSRRILAASLSIVLGVGLLLAGYLLSLGLWSSW